MTLDLIIDVVIGLVLIFALFALLTTTLVELLNAVLNRRGRTLERGLYELLDGNIGRRRGLEVFYRRARTFRGSGSNSTLLTDQFLRLNTTKALMEGERLPSYLSPDAFASGMMVLVAREFGPVDASTDLSELARNRDSRLSNIIQEFFFLSEGERPISSNRGSKIGTMTIEIALRVGSGGNCKAGSSARDLSSRRRSISTQST